MVSNCLAIRHAYLYHLFGEQASKFTLILETTFYEVETLHLNSSKKQEVRDWEDLIKGCRMERREARHRQNEIFTVSEGFALHEFLK